MVEKNERKPSILPKLREECKRTGSGMILDANTDPETIGGLPEHIQKCIKDKRNVIIDCAGNLILPILNK